MARTVRDTALESRAARGRLPTQKKPYWRPLHQGSHLGYYRGARGGSWCARQFGGGKYRETKLGIADDVADADGVAVLSFRQAQDKARAWFSEQAHLLAGLEPATSGPYTVGGAITDYLRSYERRGKSVDRTKATIDAHILPALGTVEVRRLTARLLRDWHEGLAATPARLRSRAEAGQRYRPETEDADALRKRKATANRNLTVLKAALNHAWREGRVPNDEAWRRVSPFHNVEEPVIRYLMAEECVRLVNACAADFRPLVQAALLTGARYGELRVLRPSDFDPDAGILTIRTSKAGKHRHVVLSDEGKQFFATQVRSQAASAPILHRSDEASWGTGHQRRPLTAACEAAKIDPAISFHVLRHTHGATLAMKGVPLAVIAKQLGHADIRMTERHYAHLAPSYVAETIRASFPNLGIVEADGVTALRAKRARATRG